MPLVRATGSNGRTSYMTTQPEAGACTPVFLAPVTFVLGALYGYGVATAFSPGAEGLAAMLMGFCTWALAFVFWRLYRGSRQAGHWRRMGIGAVSLVCALPCAVFLATVLLLVLQNPVLGWQKPADIVELGMFMVRFTIVHAAFITLPVSALAGALAVVK